jgi:hypothetical protein
MRVLLINTPQSPKLRGGDTVQMEKTAEALRELKIEVKISTAAEPDARGFDIAHVFNLRTIDATERQVAALARHGVPIVMSPIYLDISQALWGSTAVAQIFSGGKGDRSRTCPLFSLPGQLTTDHGQLIKDHGRRNICLLTSRPLLCYNERMIR